MEQSIRQRHIAACLNNAKWVTGFFAKGHLYDNAVCECFFKYLKKEGTDRKVYSTKPELEMSLFAYIEGLYNNARPYFANKGLTPNDEAEKDYFSEQ